MSTHSNESETKLSPDEAFGVLGNQTRIKILQTLGEAGYGESLSFSELRDRVDIPQGRQFNYHLDKLVGHFVTKTETGYALRPAGHRVVEAVLSGAVTDDPPLGPVQADAPCPYCGSPIEVEFHQDRLHRYCPECPGTYGHTALPGVSIDPADRGYLGLLRLPPAGIQERDPEAVVAAAAIWTHLTFLTSANELCPRCSASLETSVRVCDEHDTSDGLCDVCGYRQGVCIVHACVNCTFNTVGEFALRLLTNFDFVAFLVAHEVNPVSPVPENWKIWKDYDEDIISVDPFKARFTFSIGDDSITLTVDDDLTVIDATTSTTSEQSKETA